MPAAFIDHKACRVSHAFNLVANHRTLTVTGHRLLLFADIRCTDDALLKQFELPQHARVVTGQSVEIGFQYLVCTGPSL